MKNIMFTIVLQLYKRFPVLLRQSQWVLLILAVAMSVAALTSVSLLSARVSLTLSNEATHLIAADALLQNDRFLPKAAEQVAQQKGLQTAITVNFPAVVSASSLSINTKTNLTKSVSASSSALLVSEVDPVLASVKAVSDTYPLRGQLRIRQANQALLIQAPKTGEAYVDAALLESLNINVGDQIELGTLSVRVAGVIEDEPDRGLAFVSFAPRLMISLSDLNKAGFEPGQSRMSYRLLVAGNVDQLADWKAELTPKLESFEKIESANESRPETRRILQQTESFLSLIALCAACLTLFAIVMVVNVHVAKQARTWAIYRTLGASQGFLIRYLLGDFVGVFLMASAIGIGLGALLDGVLSALASPILGAELPDLSFKSWLNALFFPLLLACSLMLPLLLMVAKKLLKAPLIGSLKGISVRWQDWLNGWMLLPIAVFLVLVLWVLKFSIQNMAILFGFLGVLAVLLVMFSGLLRGLSSWSLRWRHGPWRWASRVMARRQSSVLLPMSAITLTLFFCLMILFLRSDLVKQWQSARVKDAPNRFAFNIQPDQVETFKQTLVEQQKRVVDLDPIVRGRLVEINGRAVNANSFENESAKRHLSRELNLTYRDSLPEHNTLVSGSFWSKGESASMASIEDGFAHALGLKIGDTLGFDVGGEQVVLRVSSLRKVDWTSLRANYFVIGASSALADLPQSYLSTWRGERGDGLSRRLIKALPNITVVDADSSLQKTQATLQQLLGLVQAMSVLLIACAAAVLAAALLNTMDQKRREIVLLRTIGASGAFLKRSQRFEMILIGLFSGVVATVLAYGALVILADRLFSFVPSVSGWWLLVGVEVALVVAYLVGWWAQRGINRFSSADLLRES